MVVRHGFLTLPPSLIWRKIGDIGRKILHIIYKNNSETQKVVRLGLHLSIYLGSDSQTNLSGKTADYTR